MSKISDKLQGLAYKLTEENVTLKIKIDIALQMVDEMLQVYDDGWKPMRERFTSLQTLLRNACCGTCRNTEKSINEGFVLCLKEERHKLITCLCMDYKEAERNG